MHTLISVSSSQLSEKYGNIFSIRRGLTNIVYVSGYKAVKEALVSDSFARCVTPLFDDIYKGRGKAMCTMCAVVLFRLNSIQWKENKALSNLFFLYHGTWGKGLSFTNGYSWRKHQQFSVSFFKNFGESRETLQHKIQQECYFLCEAFEQEQGEFYSKGATTALLSFRNNSSLSCSQFSGSDSSKSSGYRLSGVLFFRHLNGFFKQLL